MLDLRINLGSGAQEAQRVNASSGFLHVLC